MVAPLLAEADGEEGANAAVQQLAKAFKSAGRGSDAIGRLGKTEFAIIAPNTDSAGALRLAERLAEAIRAMDTGGPEAPPSFELRAGYDAVSDAREAPAAARDVLMRATIALRKSKTNGREGDWIRPFETRAGLS